MREEELKRVMKLAKKRKCMEPEAEDKDAHRDTGRENRRAEKERGKKGRSQIKVNKCVREA